MFPKARRFTPEAARRGPASTPFASRGPFDCSTIDVIGSLWAAPGLGRWRVLGAGAR
jgi:hypothetical protein